MAYFWILASQFFVSGKFSLLFSHVILADLILAKIEDLMIEN